MKQKNPSSLTRILGYAGGHRNLTILGCILSALSAVLGLAPYLCVWLVARSVLSAWPSLDGAGDLGRWGWMAVWTAVGSILLYFAGPHVHSHRGLPHRPEHPARPPWPMC